MKRGFRKGSQMGLSLSIETDVPPLAEQPIELIDRTASQQQ